ncbi:MAG: hypothetical protein KGI45_02595 [Patescibacteria group bacterium]|nr:hypothetical protein [Patescibacteria group bacterium]MDE1940666.1 hypothetical protein [Patescibacteria group bacterium]MDE1966941.1 hypothetical protein [Patescibacteria group bacterium]
MKTNLTLLTNAGTFFLYAFIPALLMIASVVLLISRRRDKKAWHASETRIKESFDKLMGLPLEAPSEDRNKAQLDFAAKMRQHLSLWPTERHASMRRYLSLHYDMVDDW